MAWGAAAAVLLGAAMLANAVPAYRAVRIDPVRALRNG
jgi:ABC-type antimicrobial peptide transport system permease subunit